MRGDYPFCFWAKRQILLTLRFCSVCNIHCWRAYLTSCRYQKKKKMCRVTRKKSKPSLQLPEKIAFLRSVARKKVTRKKKLPEKSFQLAEKKNLLGTVARKVVHVEWPEKNSYQKKSERDLHYELTTDTLAFPRLSEGELASPAHLPLLKIFLFVFEKHSPEIFP